jgi:hypothetical protein
MPSKAIRLPIVSALLCLACALPAADDAARGGGADAADGSASSAAPVTIFADDLDFAALRKDVLDSPFLSASQPVMVQAMPMIQQAFARTKADSGVDVAALLADIAEVRLEAVLVDGQPHVRFALRCPTTPGATWTALLGSRLDGPVLADLAWAHQGDWEMGAAGIAPVLPDAVPVAPGLEAYADDRFRFDITAAAANADASARAEFARLGLTRLLGGGRYRSGEGDIGLDLPGAALPLAPLDPAACALLPDHPLLVATWGLDGPGLAKIYTDLAADPAEHDAMLKSSAGIQTVIGMDPPTALAALGGTWVFAVTPGVPFPAVTWMATASPALDRLVDACGKLGGVDLAPARSGPVVLPTPKFPELVQIRRTATQWIITSDTLLLDRAAGDADAFDPAKLADATLLAGKPVFACWQDSAQLMRFFAGMLALGVGPMSAQARNSPDPNQQQMAKLMPLMVQALNSGAPRMVPALALATQDAAGAHLRMHNGMMQMSVVSMLAGAMLPAIAMVRETARRTTSGNNERQLVLGSMVWANDHDQKWPPTLEQMMKDNGDMPAKMLKDPSDLTNPHPYLYVRPATTVTAMQPVIVEDPACNHGKLSMVCYGDGHVGQIKGDAAKALWATAERLARDPAAATTGITPDQWQDDPAAGDAGGATATPAGDAMP